MKKWQCSICGYIHEGEAPPEVCPVCGADKSKFVPLSEDPAEPAAAPTPAPAGALGKAGDFMVKLHAHPISVHIPNGVLPLSVLFVLLAVFFQLEGFSQAAGYNMVFVLLAMPFVLFSGYIDWKKRLGGNLTRIILTKMICGATVLVGTLAVVAWRVVDPSITTATASGRWLFLLLHIVLLVAATVAGYCGGKLVFDKA